MSGLILRDDDGTMADYYQDEDITYLMQELIKEKEKNKMAGFVSKPTQGKVEFKLRAELGSVQKNKKQQIRVNLVDIIPPGRNAMTMLCLQTFEQDDEGNYAPMRGQQIYVRYTAKDEFIKILEALPDDPTKIKTSTKKVEPDDEDPFS